MHLPQGQTVALQPHAFQKRRGLLKAEVAVTIAGRFRVNQIELLIMLEQIRTLDKVRFIRLIGHLDEEIMKRIDQAAARSISLNDD